MVKARYLEFGRGQDAAGADFSGRERDKVYVSRGGKGFAEVSYLSGADAPQDGRAFARADLDRDGYEDAVVINRNAPLVRIFRNTAGPRSGNAFVGLELQGVVGTGPGPRSSRDAANARVTLRCDGRTLAAEQVLGSGMGVLNSRVLTLGLGRCDTIESLQVRFPSGAVVKAEKLPARRRYLVVEGGEVREVPGVYGAGPATAAAGAPDAGAPNAGAPNAVGGRLAAAERSRGNDGSEEASLPTGASDGRRLLAALGAPERELVVVELWATWCEACKRLAPRLGRLGARFGERVAMVGLSMEPKDDAAAVERHLAEHPSPFPLRPHDGPAAAAAERLLGGELVATPSTIVLEGRTGAPLWAGPGIPTESDLARLLWQRGARGDRP